MVSVLPPSGPGEGAPPASPGLQEENLNRRDQLADGALGAGD